MNETRGSEPTRPIAGRGGNARTIKLSLVIRSVYAVCLAGATWVHVAAHLQFGVLLGALAAHGYPLGTRLYWSSLTILDPVAAILLFARPRIGLALATAIISSDVAHNSWTVYRFGGVSDPKYWAQLAFLVFVFATVRVAWRGVRAAQDSTPQA